MGHRVNWRMEYEMLAWVSRQERASSVKSMESTMILQPQTPRDEVVRTFLTEIESHDGLFGAGSLPESIL